MGSTRPRSAESPGTNTQSRQRVGSRCRELTLPAGVSVIEFVEGDTAVFGKHASEIRSAIIQEVTYQFELAALETFDQLDFRAKLLLAVADEARPSGRGAEFLRRVSRCFLFGFHMEAFIICRSVLESELKAEIAVDDCMEMLPEGGSKRRNGQWTFTIEERIEVAQRLNRLSAETATKAHIVRRRANALLHERSQEGVDAWVAIGDTIEVLQQLSRRGHD